MSIAIGIAMAVAMCLAARFIGFDRDRAFYPVLLIAIASYDLVFAALTQDAGVIVAEFLLAMVFIVMAVIGFRKWPVLVLLGLVGHAAADVVHPHMIANGGIPAWWPGFCAGFDVATAVVFGFLLYAAIHAESHEKIDPLSKVAVERSGQAK
ncbi:hypothetical protein [Dyella amyloliquefaciens]|uniref:hypothetical protein n=1 Tax=Dyella amyloliquefaciens TaxID=1770545 RepID=UPI00102E453A|nr:hypothetical protein [Dyella amyloliquefaciens]